jgi:DNA-binding transcriptional regulator YiaG
VKKPSCRECGGKLVVRAGAVEIDVAGYRVKDPSIRVPVCEKCHWYEMGQLDLEESERRAAIVVLNEIDGPSGHVLKFARKAMGLRQADLARALGSSPETVCRWEANEHIDRQVSLAVAQLLTMYEQEPEAFDLAVKAASAPSPSELVVRRRKLA